MNRISNLFDFKKSKITNERQAVIKEFVDILNISVGEQYKDKEGKWKKVKEISPRAVAIKLSHLSQLDLYHFLSSCRQSKSGFRKCFFGSLKTR